MMKYVYKNEKGLVVLEECVGIMDLASVSDFRNEIKLIKEKLAKQENYRRIFLNNPNFVYKRTIHDELGIGVHDELTLDDDILYWDRDVNEFLSLELIQKFDNPYSWTDKEKVEFSDILINWIIMGDLTSNLYTYLRETNEGEGVFDEDEYTEKLERLLYKYLKKDNTGEEK